MTSLNECFPMVILESFGMGVPVIANDCPTGPRNIITDEENGFLVKYNDVDDFVKTFNKFDDSIDLQKRMSEQAIETSQVYRVDKIMNMWNEKVFK
jgi:glycosyltransferase involved in cell wall biosynthesis